MGLAPLDHATPGPARPGAPGRGSQGGSGPLILVIPAHHEFCGSLSQHPRISGLIPCDVRGRAFLRVPQTRDVGPTIQHRPQSPCTLCLPSAERLGSFPSASPGALKNSQNQRSPAAARPAGKAHGGSNSRGEAQGGQGGGMRGAGDSVLRSPHLTWGQPGTHGREGWAVGAPGIAFLQVKLVKEGSLEEERLMEGLEGRGKLNQEGRQAGTMGCVHREE